MLRFQNANVRSHPISSATKTHAIIPTEPAVQRLPPLQALVQHASITTDDTWHVTERPHLRRNVACVTRMIFFALCQGGDLHNLKQQIAQKTLRTNSGSPPPGQRPVT